MTFRDLLPPAVEVDEGRVDDARWARLVPPRERALVTGRPERVTEFVAGRGCARSALRALGLEPDLLAVGEDRGPVWPGGVVGSITHAGGEVAAAVSDDPDLIGLGIDVEPVADLDDATAAVVSSIAERERAARLGLGRLGPLVVFCAKEAVFKAWAPGRGWLDFDRADVTLLPDGSLRAAVGATTLVGRWQVVGDVVRATALLARDPAPPRPPGSARVPG